MISDTTHTTSINVYLGNGMGTRTTPCDLKTLFRYGKLFSLVIQKLAKETGNFKVGRYITRYTRYMTIYKIYYAFFDTIQGILRAIPGI